MSDFSWEHLLQAIDQGVVVPIVGPDVLQLEIGGKKTLLYTWLAEQFAQKLKITVKLKVANPLDAAVTAYLQAGGDLDTVYLTLSKLTKETASLEVPQSLRKLAEIRPFKLFLTTTFDPMLQRAVDEVRFPSAKHTKSLSFRARRTEDISPELLKRGLPIVFHLFGRAELPEFAVTEEDFLEYVSALQSDSLRPRFLFDELHDRYLLMIGNGFCDWLARFFIRGVKCERLSITRHSDFVADNESGFLGFLIRWAHMKIFTTGGPIPFIDELHSRWMKEQQGKDPGALAPPPSAPLIPGSVFISYASEDQEKAREARDLLDNEGFDVWLDLDRIGAGDTFDPKIARAIDNSAVFMPIISRNTLTNRPRYLNSEWKHALAIDDKLSPGASFIVPLLVDETPYNAPALPERFRALSWDNLDEQFPREQFVKSLRAVVRRYRSAAAGRVA